MKKYICPVCGYPEISGPPENSNICICCGTHFGYEDRNTTHETLRRDWVENGMRFYISWFKKKNWNPAKQLEVFSQ